MDGLPGTICETTRNQQEILEQYPGRLCTLCHVHGHKSTFTVEYKDWISVLLTLGMELSQSEIKSCHMELKSVIRRC